MRPLWLYYSDRDDDEAQFITGHALALRCLVDIDILHHPPIHEVAHFEMWRQLEENGILRGVIVEYRRPKMVTTISTMVRAISKTVPIVTVGWDKHTCSAVEPANRFNHWTVAALDVVRRHSAVSAGPRLIQDVSTTSIIDQYRRHPHPTQSLVAWERDVDQLRGLVDAGRIELKNCLLTMAGYELPEPGQGLTRKDVSLGNDVGMLYHHMPTGEEVVMRGYGQHRKAEPRLRWRLERAEEFYEDCGLESDGLFTPMRDSMAMGLVFYSVIGYETPIVQLSESWAERERLRSYARRLAAERRLLTVNEECSWFE